MGKELVTAVEVRRRSPAVRLPLFDQIAQGFLEFAASQQKSGEVLTCRKYLDGAVEIDGVVLTRRAAVLAIEDLKQETEAPLTLQSEARAQMSQLKLNPNPELNLYRDIATAILRMDSALSRHGMIQTPISLNNSATDVISIPMKKAGNGGMIGGAGLLRRSFRDRELNPKEAGHGCYQTAFHGDSDSHRRA